MRVLIVDDQEFIRRGVRAVLMDAEDIEVCGEAGDGREAVVKAQQHKPDVVIMDISMPRYDGLEATREIRRLLPNTQVVTLSQYELPELIRQAWDSGAATHVSKLSVWTSLIPALRSLPRENTFISDGSGRLRASLIEGPPTRAALEKALRESDERFRTTFEQSAVGMGHVREDGHWLRVNQKLCEMLGYRRDELRIRRFQDICHREDLRADLEQARRIAAGEIDHYSLEARQVRKDGQVVWVDLTVNAVRDDYGRVKYCVRVLEDCAARKEAQQKLAQTKRDLQIAAGHLELVANQMAAALTYCSRDLRYLWVNQNYADWLKRPLHKIIGLPIADVLGKQAFEILRPRFAEVLTGQKVACEHQVILEGIGLRRIFVSYAPTLNPAGVADGWIALVQDLTAQKEELRLQVRAGHLAT